MNRVFRLIIDGKSLITEHQFLTGEQLKKLANIALDNDLFLVVPQFQDELIENETVVNLARPGFERFESRPSGGSMRIIVNGSPHPYNATKISYEQVVEIAFGKSNNPKQGYTVTYTDGPEENRRGVMAKGSVVYVKSKMKFNVTQTHLS